MMQGDMNRSNRVINKTGLKWSRYKCMHKNEEVLTAQHYQEISQPFQKAQLGASLKCNYTNAHFVGNWTEELDIYLQLQVCGVTGITDLVEQFVEG